MDKIKEHNFNKWSVDKGDYKRDEESTISYLKKKNLRRRMKQAFWIILYFSLVVAISYFIFAEL